MKKKSLLFIITLFLLTGCHMMTPEQTLTTFLNGLKKQNARMVYLSYGGKMSKEEIEEDIDVADDYLHGVDTTNLKKEALKKFLDFDFTINAVALHNNHAKIQVTITTYDSGKLLKDWLEDYQARVVVTKFSGAKRFEIKEKAIEKLTNDIAHLTQKDYQSTVYFTLTKKSSWKVDELSDEVKNALTGGLLETVERLND
ncbi:hypothetical protein [Sharpea porci]|uniref:hypothetical protein n=1 Tax=Sharpea porci TaxID=2652286 RepID=UPI002A90EFEF|nr:hypothetical protein [Sharpea porci]MDY5280090.1 hypothetical protein [Sharpea porci]